MNFPYARFLFMMPFKNGLILLRYSSTDSVLFLSLLLYFYHKIPHVSHFLSPCPNLHLILGIPSERLLTRFDELAINLALSINCNM